jgi:hypothetical protein
MFEGDSADMCAGKFSLMSMGAKRSRPGNSGGSWESHSKRQIGIAETFWLILRYFVVNSNRNHKSRYLTMKFCIISFHH